MSAVSFSRRARETANGSALVIVLFFIVLLSVVTIAFLARSLIAVRVSASSAGETKSKILAGSAGDIIIGDLKQEIIAGSAANSGTVNYPIYTPSSNKTMIPFQNGVPTSGTLIPNLISRSVSPKNTSGSAPYVSYPASYSSSVPPNRAASDPTAATADATSKVNSSTPSLNGRYVSPAQWNSPYLIPRDPGTDTPGSTSVDSTPISSFVPPDWVVVTRAGATSVLSTSFGSGGLNDPTLTNTNFAVGRYAFAIYNEGGLLDMNATGYPADPTNPGAANSNGLTSAQISRKGSLALADLTQLPASATSTVTMTQSQINNFVGWRNYASAQLTAANGSYGNFSFTPTTASNWLTNFVTANTNGFMQIVGTATPPTDQALLSRQQLISVVQSLGISPDFLQYMGTFSRALEQPSFVPDPNRPRIINTATPPPGNTAVATYAGNNDSVGKDDSYNPSFLSIRWTGTNNATFRLNGTSFVSGEPLVKTKFALKWLGLVTYNATNTSLPAGFATTTTDPDPIYDRFGLKRTSTSAPWTYNHGQDYIMTLAQVAAANREPDCAELLKAAICVGSVAKGAPNNLNSYYNWNYSIDKTTDYDILQVMANLIDQADTDSYPTQIQILLPTGTSGTGPYHVLSGVEDLPYIYRWHAMTVVDQLPTPASALITQAQNGTVTAPANFNGGDFKELYTLDLWNPHDATTLVTSSTNRPTQFRIYATWQDPDGNTTAWTTAALGVTTPSPSVYPVVHGSSLALTQANTAMTITDTSGGLAFREPTMIWRPSYPSGISILAPNGNIVDAVNTGTPSGSTTVSYCGIVVGSMPVEAVDANNKIWQALQAGIDTNYKVPAGGAYSQINFALQYADPNNAGNFITYDNFYTDIHGLQMLPNIVANSADTATYPNGDYQSPFKSNQVTQWGGGTVMDPRTIRFGVATGSFLGEAGHSAIGPNTGDFLLEPTAYSNFVGGNQPNNTGTPTMNATIGNTYTLLETDRPRADAGNVVNYSNPCQSYNPPPIGPCPQMRFYSGAEYRGGSGTTNASGEYNGLFAQNTPAIQSASLAQNGTYTQAQLYYEDADGVNRRASGAYAPTALTGSMDNAAADEVGIPTVTADTYQDGGVLTGSNILPQSQNRPIILNRPFRSVSDMSYAFHNSPWKNIDFFTPESGDSALVDTFCINEPPPAAMVAGKVDLNTRQIPVLKALINGGYTDEFYNYGSSVATSAFALKPLTPVEAGNVATALVGITTAPDAWRGPLQNISGLVGRYIANPGTGAATATDAYYFQDPSATPANIYCYAGLSAALGGGAAGPGANIYSDTSVVPANVPVAVPYTIQRFCEAGLRPLMDAGQVRVWNLLIDVIAQTGHYPKTATGLDQFLVEGQKRVWIHVAIDRYTGQVLDKQTEVVTP